MVAKANTVLHELYRSVVTKREVSTVKFCISLCSDPYLSS